MVTVDLQTWASAASILAVGLTALGMLSRKVDGLRTELKGEIGRLEERMNRGFSRVESRLDTLEQRTFELSTRLPPLPTRAE
jgi:hypothetical protein